MKIEKYFEKLVKFRFLIRIYEVCSKSIKTKAIFTDIELSNE